MRVLSNDPILITGAAGFIGYRLAETLLLQYPDQKLYLVDYLSAFTDRPEHKHFDPQILIDLHDLESFLKKKSKEDTTFQLAAVFHMGAITSTDARDLNALRILNVEYSQFLWNYCSDTNTPYFYASSAATYGDGDQGYDDDENRIDQLKPLNAYGQSKQTFDQWALAKEKEGISPPSWAGFKFFNVYGFGERHKGPQTSLVVKGFDQVTENGRISLFKSHRDGIPDGGQMRDFVWVDDVCDVLIFSYKKPVKRGIFNLGTGKARSFLDFAIAIFKAMDRKQNIEFKPTPEQYRNQYQYFTEAKMEKLRSEGYTRPMTDLETGVQESIRRMKIRS